MLVRSQALLGLLMLLGLLAPPRLVHAAFAPPARQAATLSDGTVVTLEGVTYGKVRRFGNLAIEPFSFETAPPPDSRDAIILWIHGERPADASTGLMGLQFGPVRIFDGAGKEFVAYELAASSRYLRDYYRAVMLYAWPRRSSDMVVEVPYERKPTTVRFRVRNPVVVRMRPFPSAPTPIVRRDAELEVTLDGLYQMPEPMAWSGFSDHFALVMRGRKLNTRVSFRYRFRGRATTEWLPTEASITDSTGNPYPSAASSLYQPPQYPLTYYRSDTDEPLKMDVWFQRTANADFAPREVGVMNNLPMRIGSYLYNPGAKARVGDVTLELNSVGEVECVGKRTQMIVNVYGGDPHTGLLMKVRNERGQAANGIGPNEKARWITGSLQEPDRYRDQETGNLSPHRSFVFLMDLPRGTSRITCSIAVNVPHFFEFTPTPTVMQDLRSPWRAR